jgi:hypothetical protein
VPRAEAAEETSSQPVADAAQDLRSQPGDVAPGPTADGALLTQPSLTPEPVPPAATVPVRQDWWLLLPWLSAALFSGALAAFLIYRRRSLAALETVGELETFVPPEPVSPGPTPSPERRVSAPSATGGIVSARLRPAIDLELSPTRCVIDERQATVEFTLVAMNSGNAPARDVRVEVALVNAGPAQDREIAAFFEAPAGVGDPLEIIPPMRSIRLDSRVTMPIDQVRAFEVAGRKLFVPMLAFNALYRWSGGDGQTSLSYLVGRDGKGEKLAPFRMDLGPRIFRGLGARPHHLQVRR